MMAVASLRDLWDGCGWRELGGVRESVVLCRQTTENEKTRYLYHPDTTLLSATLFATFSLHFFRVCSNCPAAFAAVELKTVIALVPPRVHLWMSAGQQKLE